MIQLFLTMAFASVVCVKQPPTKDKMCVIYNDNDLVIENMKCKSPLVQEPEFELYWMKRNDSDKYDAFWRCQWCFNCEAIK